MIGATHEAFFLPGRPNRSDRNLRNDLKLDQGPDQRDHARNKNEARSPGLSVLEDKRRRKKRRSLECCRLLLVSIKERQVRTDGRRAIDHDSCRFFSLLFLNCGGGTILSSNGRERFTSATAVVIIKKMPLCIVAFTNTGIENERTHRRGNNRHCRCQHSMVLTN